MAKYAAALDQGTTSTRCMIFDHGGEVVSVAQKEHEQIYPEAGLGRARPEGDLGAHAGGDRRGARRRRRERRRHRRRSASPTSARPRSCGTEHRRAGAQRDRLAGHAHRQARRRALAPTAARTASASRPACRWRPTSRARRSAGSSTTSTAPREQAEAGDLLFGNMDTWCIWNLTGGTDGGLHITDVTNASRTMLMDLETLDWDEEIASIDRRADVDAARDPAPRARSTARSRPGGMRTACRSPATSATSRRRRSARPASSLGEAKNTYGTGNFLLLNTGTEAVQSKNGPAHHGRLQDRRPATRSTASRARSRSPARSCSGCATT